MEEVKEVKGGGQGDGVDLLIGGQGDVVDLLIKKELVNKSTTSP
jgi:hypothetical protein